MKRGGWSESALRDLGNHLTDERGCDGAIAPALIGQTGHINSITVDKGYDQIGVYEASLTHLKQVVKRNQHIKFIKSVSLEESIRLLP